MSESCGFGPYHSSAGAWSWAHVFQGQARGVYAQHPAYHAGPQQPWVQQWGWSQAQAQRSVPVPTPQQPNPQVPVQNNAVKYRLNANAAAPSAEAASASTTSPNVAAPQSSASSPDSNKKEENEDVWGYLEAQASFLGPSLWDNGDLKMEYMDLDEFLCENGIPMGEGLAGRSPAKSLTPPHSMSAASDGSSGSGLVRRGTETLASVIDSDDDKPGSSNGGCYDADSPVALLNHEDRVLNDDEESNASEASSALLTKSVTPTPAGRRKRTAVSISSCGNTSDDGSYVPGHDFDPKSRQFSPEELRPQPMSKKSKKQYVPDDMKDDKYWARRRKNNMAAKRSRDARRVKENQIAMRAAFLEKENAVLKAELDKVTKLYAAALKRLEQYEKQGKK